MKKNILITGSPGCGKSTLIEKIIKGIEAPLTGFLTREIREKGKRVGFTLETFSGMKGILAHVKLESPARVGRYSVSIEALETIAVPAFRAGSPDILIVIDEIGKMECLSPLFQERLLLALDSPNPVLASITEKGTPFIEGIKAREDIVLHKVLMTNRDHLATVVTHELKALL